MKNLFVFLFVLLIYFTSFGQSESFKGIVLDKSNNTPIPFANISIAGQSIGTTTDIDGMFGFSVEQSSSSVFISHLSYYTAEYQFIRGKNRFDTIFLEPKAIDLTAVSIYPEENPAHRIIDSVRAHAKFNNPNKIDRYACTIYEKFVISIDSTFFVEENITDTLSNIDELREYIADKDILLMENVVEKVFIAPDRGYNHVIASKFSGTENPFFVMLLTQLQETTLYDPMVDVGGIKYLSPLSKGSQKHYFFLMEDTTFSERGDTVFHISYRPRIGISFDGIEGVMAVNTSGWAIQNSTAASVAQEFMGKKAQLNIRQIFRRNENEQWFFHQTHIDLSIPIFEQITMLGIGRSYYEDVNINPSEKIKNLWGTGIKVDDEAVSRNNDFWEEYRVVPLSKRDKNTYHFLDSLNKEHNLESKFRFVEELADLKIRLWKFNLDLQKIVNYQDYQGFYLGLGMSTNHDFSKIFELGGFGGYGFKDKTSKYGGYGSVMFYRPVNLKLRLGYSFDGVTVCTPDFYREVFSLLSEDFYSQFYVSKVDYTERMEASIFINPLPYMQTEIVFAHDCRRPSYEYLFVPTQQNSFEITTMQLRLRYAFREPRIKSSLFNRPLAMGSNNKYPILSITLAKGFKSLLNGDFDFSRINAQLYYKIHWPLIGRTKIMLQGGCVFGEVPYSLLGSPTGTYSPNVGFSVYNTFNAMRRNEFINDRYLYLFFSHDFRKLFYQSGSSLYSIQPEVVTNIGWGSLSKPENHQYLELQDMRRVYFESGVILRKLLLGFDFGVIYRYGAYAFDKTIDNFSFVIGVSF